MSSPKAIRSRIWCGTYISGELGWLLPDFAQPNGGSPLSTAQRKMLVNNQRTYFPGDLYRCEITIKALKNKRGEYIIKRNHRKEPA